MNLINFTLYINNVVILFIVHRRSLRKKKRRRNGLLLVKNQLLRKLRKDPKKNLAVNKVKVILKKSTHLKNLNQSRHASFLPKRRRVLNLILMRTGAKRRERKE